AKAVALEDRRRGVNRAETHLCRIEAGPFRVDDAPDRRKTVALDGRLRREQHPGRAVGDLRAVSRRDAAVLAIEKGLELAERFERRIAPDAVVERVDGAVAVVQRLDFTAARSQ